MPCCKADIHGWCKELDVVQYRDEDDREYCVFHAPKGKKGVTLIEFNNLLFDRIDLSKNLGVCDLSGTVFEGDICFNKYNIYNPLIKLNFSGAHFSRIADFSQSHFIDIADFSDAHFSGVADFSKTVFNGISVFSKARFNGVADFKDAFFSRVADFSETQFNGVADFSEAQFNGIAYFKEAKFSGVARFSEAKFSGIAYFKEACFSGVAYFADETLKIGVFFNDLKATDRTSSDSIDLRNVSPEDTDIKSLDFVNPPSSN